MAKIALKIIFELKRFSHKVGDVVSRPRRLNRAPSPFSFFSITLGLDLSDTKVYET